MLRSQLPNTVGIPKCSGTLHLSHKAESSAYVKDMDSMGLNINKMRLSMSATHTGACKRYAPGHEDNARTHCLICADAAANLQATSKVQISQTQHSTKREAHVLTCNPMSVQL